MYELRANECLHLSIDLLTYGCTYLYDECFYIQKRHIELPIPEDTINKFKNHTKKDFIIIIFTIIIIYIYSSTIICNTLLSSSPPSLLSSPPSSKSSPPSSTSMLILLSIYYKFRSCIHL